jgi:biopolymer transport protein ExbB
MKQRILFATACLLLLPALAHAWWHEDWPYRKKITLNTSAAGAATSEAAAELPVLVRLHTGNFTFLDAKEDGSDLRFIAQDDKTPLHFHIEQWDPVSDLALVWVRVPLLSPAAATDHIWLYFGNQKAQREDDPKQRYDAAQTLDLHFNQPQGAPVDYSDYAHPGIASTATYDAQGPIDGAAAFSGSSSVRVPAAPTLRLNPQTGFTFSALVKIGGPQSQAILLAQQEGANGVSLAIQGTRLVAAIGSARVQGNADLAPNSWHHVAMTIGGGNVKLYLDGKAVGEAPATLADTGGDVVVGQGLLGSLDEVQLASVARSADWIKAAWAAQGPEAKLVAIGEDQQAEGGGGHSYFKILLGAVTLDGWVVIAILMVMMIISFAVMVAKGVFVTRTDKANRIFIERFQKDPGGLIDPRYAEGGAKDLVGSPLFRLYRIGLRELKQRFDLYEQHGQPKALSPQALGAIKASLDAGMVRESARLNNQMVLLTIAISGGPFLGLLGTVVGVMITFAAIAAAGDVNVNSIAPGIAAALVATVAGLAVAIPALFGYNYLASRIKNLSNDMTVFADELVTRLAEKYAP